MGERSTGASGQDQSVAAWEAGRKGVPDSPSFDFKILCDTLDNWKLWEEVTDSPSFSPEFDKFVRGVSKQFIVCNWKGLSVRFFVGAILSAEQDIWNTSPFLGGSSHGCAACPAGNYGRACLRKKFEAGDV